MGHKGVAAESNDVYSLQVAMDSIIFKPICCVFVPARPAVNASFTKEEPIQVIGDLLSHKFINVHSYPTYFQILH